MPYAQLISQILLALDSSMILLDVNGVSFDVIYQAAGRMAGTIGEDTDYKYLYTTPYIKRILNIGVGYQNKIIRENDIDDNATMAQVLKEVGATKKEVNIKMTKAFEIEHQKRMIPVKKGKVEKSKNTTRAAATFEAYDAGNRKSSAKCYLLPQKGEDRYDRKLVKKIKKYVKDNDMVGEWINVEKIGCSVNMDNVDNIGGISEEDRGLLVKQVLDEAEIHLNQYVRYNK